MKLSSYIDERLIFTDVEASSKEEMIEKLIDLVAQKDKIVAKRRDELLKEVLKREGEVSTALGSGISIPHARVENFEEFVIAVATVKEPIKAQLAASSMEDEVKLFIMILADNLKNKRVLKVMSGFMKVAVKNPVELQNLKEATSPSEIYNILGKTQIDVDSKITAEDLLSNRIDPAHPLDTLEDIASRLVSENTTALPVVSENEIFIGEITEKELIKFGLPDYMCLMQDVSFLTVGEPFEEYLKNEKVATIENLYRKDDITIVDRKAPVMEICFKMVNQGKTRIYVVEDGKYYGMILRSDIIKKILHL